MNRLKNFFKNSRLWLYPLVTVVLLATGFLLYSGVKLGASAVSSWWNEEEDKPTKSAETRTMTTTTTHVIRVGREKRLYLFSNFPDGIIKTKIELGEVDFYPKGGKIKIIPPLPATPWEDEPGTTMPRVERPPGWYTITKINPSATGVEVWN